MARQDAITAGSHANGDALPPSTLAAQIVQNQNRPSVTKYGEQQALFASLLQEILHNPTANVETNIDTNVQLIRVLVEAGLDVLAREQPFAQNILLDRATDSVAVIERTIARQPALLIHPVSQNGPPLCLWLFVRIASIAGRHRAIDVATSSLLCVVAETFGGNVKLWRFAVAFKAVLAETKLDVLQALEKRKPKRTLDLRLPPARVIPQLWPEADGLIATSHDCQAFVHDAAQAAQLALQLSKSPHIRPGQYRELSINIARRALRSSATAANHKQWLHALLNALQGTGPVYRNAVLRKLLHIMLSHRSKALALQQALANTLQNALKDGSREQHGLLQEMVQRLQTDERFPMLNDKVQTVIESAFKQGPMPTRIVSAESDVLSVKDSHLRRTRRKRRKVHEPLPNVKTSNYVKSALAYLGLDEVHASDLTQRTCAKLSSQDAQGQTTTLRHLANIASIDPAAVVQVVSSLIERNILDNSAGPRTWCLRVFETCLRHIPTTRAVDLSQAAIGRSWLKSLQSSSRDVRVAAGSCIQFFFLAEQTSEQSLENRRLVLQWMRQLSKQNILAVQETLILAWGNVGTVCNPNELNLVLLRLIDYLGHPNALIRGLAFTELQNISTIKKGTSNVDALFNPFWSNIAVSVVQEILSCPQKVQMMCDLLGKTVNDFLLSTQIHTVPHLVSLKRKDILGRIAAARNSSSTIRDLCIQPRANLIAVMSYLISQCRNDSEDFASACLSAVDDSFSSEDLGDYVKIDSTAIACEVLKRIGQQKLDDKHKAYGSFYVLADLCERTSNQRRTHPRSNRSVPAFMQRHILGILTNFSSVIEANGEAQSIHNKTLCLQATAEMIPFAKVEVSNALPQVRALLQSAIEQPDLCEAAWSAWLNLIADLEYDDLELIMEQTFVLILRHWCLFSEELQQRTHTVVGNMIMRGQRLINECMVRLPSLASIPLLSKLGRQIDHMQSGEAVDGLCKVFSKRLAAENPVVIVQALKDLVECLEAKQSQFHEIAVSEQPSQALSDLMRSLLDVALSLSKTNDDVADLTGKAFGLIGCLDPNRVEITRKKGHVLILSNFDKADETVRWVTVLLEQYLVKAFRSVTNAQAQGFMAYTIQELLKFCGFTQEMALRPRATQSGRTNQLWQDMPETVRTTLTPFMSSKYTVTTSASFNQPKRHYPGFSADVAHSSWLRGLVYDLTWKVKGDNAKMLFPHLARIVRGHALVIPSFLLPYVTLNIILGGTDAEVNDIRQEILAVLSCAADSSKNGEDVKLCSESLFSVLDYMTVWLQEKRRVLNETRANAFRTGTSPSDFDEAKDMSYIDTTEKFLATIPVDIVARRAMDCGSYTRALFNWEQYIRQSTPDMPLQHSASSSNDSYYHLHDIYAHIDEPDGLEGISAHLTFITEEQQATLNARSGRWTAAQTWYEAKLASDHGNPELQDALLHCLQEKGRHSALLKYAQSFRQPDLLPDHARLLEPYIVEAAWMTNDMEVLRAALQDVHHSQVDNFSIGVGRLLLASKENQSDEIMDLLTILRRSITRGMTPASTGSVQSSSEDLKKLHLLAEIEIVDAALREKRASKELFDMLDKRLEVLGTYNAGKQEVLAVRRALLGSSAASVCRRYAASSCLYAARLARKDGNIENAYLSVLQASQLGARAAKLQESKLLWHEGHQRQAITAIEQAISAGVFDQGEDVAATSEQTKKQQLETAAKARLLRAKWIDAAGRHSGNGMTHYYQEAVKGHRQWEKGQYYLAKHYTQILEAERALPKTRQNSKLQTHDMVRPIVEALLRSIPFGNKYWFESIPKALTLWLDLGMEVAKPPTREDRAITEARHKALFGLHKQMRKYFDRSPAYIFYPALSQLLSRISHPQPEVWAELAHIITRIASAHPSQALWSVLALTKATDKLRQERGKEIISRLSSLETKHGSTAEVRQLITSGQKLSNALLAASEAPVEPRLSEVNLVRDLNFKLQNVPCGLVVPMERTLTINLPLTTDGHHIRSHKPFVQTKVTISSFHDRVLVLSSLQRPKKLTVRGSDGKSYGLLCKPKDDLRKDQRLMEFNSIINRALKRDAAGSKRRLYIKTYAVTPLSEESGCLEWVEGIKPIRDILLNHYTRRGIRPNYTDLRVDLNEACKCEQNLHIYQEKVQGKYPPVLHEWFTEVYPEPDTWFAARLEYARSAAVMSMTGHVLGLGDRHGENILLQEGSGGVFHVDFNCLFDKGLTFEKPELVPFRLTPNMSDAMGPYSYEGPFRKSCEVTLRLLRQNKDTLMTVLETFIHDPTTDFVGKKKKNFPGVPDTPQEILESIDAKLTGQLRGENLPLSVEGYVDALIREAVSPWNLCRMYVGWCAFL